MNGCEFLGDAVLNCVVAHAALSRIPCSAMKASYRAPSQLGSAGRIRWRALPSELNLGPWVRLGSGELKVRRLVGSKSILADTLEAIFGAIYLDGGFEARRR